MVLEHALADMDVTETAQIMSRARLQQGSEHELDADGARQLELFVRDFDRELDEGPGWPAESSGAAKRKAGSDVPSSSEEEAESLPDDQPKFVEDEYEQALQSAMGPAQVHEATLPWETGLLRAVYGGQLLPAVDLRATAGPPRPAVALASVSSLEAPVTAAEAAAIIHGSVKFSKDDGQASCSANVDGHSKASSTSFSAWQADVEP